MIGDVNRVAAWRGEPTYPTRAPYSPTESYPEFAFTGAAQHLNGNGSGLEPNHAYRGVREALRLLGLDKTQFGTRAWNPLREIVRPGDTIEIEAKLREKMGDAYFFDAKITCNGKSAVRFEFACMLAAIEGDA